MKNKLLMRFWAFMLALCLAVTSVSTFEMIRVYASDEGDDGYIDDDDDDNDHPNGFIDPTDDPTDTPTPTPSPTDDPDPTDTPTPTPEPTDTPTPTPEPTDTPTPTPSPTPQPTDYAIQIYNSNIEFGTVHEGDVIINMYFQVVNVGNTDFTLTWDAFDSNTGFILQCEDDTYLEPGDQCQFSVFPRENISKGDYSAKYVFYSAGDPSQAHAQPAFAHVYVLPPDPYIDSVTASGPTTLSPGKSASYSATVKGGNDYDPSVTWSVQGNSSQDTSIDGDGNLSVASNENSTAVTVVATSQQDPSKFGTVTVSIKKADHVVTVTTDPSDGGVATGGGAVSDGGSVNLSASANNNYAFKGWYEAGNLVSSSNNARIDGITSDRTFVAVFDRKTCYVRTDVNDDDAGTITDSASVPYGGSMTIKAKPKDGYEFDKFVENKENIGTSKTLQLNNITSDRNITAVFKKTSYNVQVTVNPANAGAVDGASTYNRGEKAVLVAYPTDGYDFTGWTINGSVVSKDRTFTIDPVKSDVNLVANFMKKGATAFTIVAGIANQGGSITPSGNYLVAQGGTVTYNIIPSAGYRIAAVMVDGLNIGTVSTYTFNNVVANHAIAASFEKKPAETPKNSSSTSSSTKVVVDDKSKDQKNTVYNDRTATEGALPEQKVVYTAVPDEVTSPDPEKHADDAYTIVVDDQTGTDLSISGQSVMAKHALDENSLRMMIREKNDLPLLREAYEDGNLMITVNNSYAADKQETAVGLYHDDPTISNFEDVIAESLTEDEKVSVLEGSQVAFNIDISDSSDTIDSKTKKSLQSKLGYKPFSYFDFVILKTAGGVTSILSTTPAELKVKLPIPEQYRKKGRKFCVIRNHNGDIDILSDVGNDPNSVTFMTDRFSEYAIAYETVSPAALALRFFIIALLGLILALLCFLQLVRHRRKMKIKARREAMIASEMSLRQHDRHV